MDSPVDSILRIEVLAPFASRTLYGAACYLLFLGSFSYFIVFVGGFLVPYTVDSGPVTTFGTAMIVNLALLLLVGTQHHPDGTTLGCSRTRRLRLPGRLASHVAILPPERRRILHLRLNRRSRREL